MGVKGNVVQIPLQTSFVLIIFNIWKTRVPSTDMQSDKMRNHATGSNRDCAWRIHNFIDHGQIACTNAWWQKQ